MSDQKFDQNLTGCRSSLCSGLDTTTMVSRVVIVAAGVVSMTTATAVGEVVLLIARRVIAVTSIVVPQSTVMRLRTYKRWCQDCRLGGIREHGGSRTWPIKMLVVVMRKVVMIILIGGIVVTGIGCNRRRIGRHATGILGGRGRRVWRGSIVSCSIVWWRRGITFSRFVRGRRRGPMIGGSVVIVGQRPRRQDVRVSLVQVRRRVRRGQSGGWWRRRRSRWCPWWERLDVLLGGGRGTPRRDRWWGSRRLVLRMVMRGRIPHAFWSTRVRRVRIVGGCRVVVWGGMRSDVGKEDVILFGETSWRSFHFDFNLMDLKCVCDDLEWVLYNVSMWYSMCASTLDRQKRRTENLLSLSSRMLFQESSVLSFSHLSYFQYRSRQTSRVFSIQSHVQESHFLATKTHR